MLSQGSGMVPQVILRQVVGDPHFENPKMQPKCKHRPSNLPHYTAPLYSPSLWCDDKIIKPRTALRILTIRPLYGSFLTDRDLWALCQWNQSNLMATVSLCSLWPWAHSSVTILTPPGCSETREMGVKVQNALRSSTRVQDCCGHFNSVWWTLLRTEVCK